MESGERYHPCIPKLRSHLLNHCQAEERKSIRKGEKRELKKGAKGRNSQCCGSRYGYKGYLRSLRNPLPTIRWALRHLEFQWFSNGAGLWTEENRQANVPQTCPREQIPIPYDSPPKQSIPERFGPKNQDESQRKTPVKERI